jgi:hypothetical protein
MDVTQWLTYIFPAMNNQHNLGGTYILSIVLHFILLSISKLFFFSSWIKPFEHGIQTTCNRVKYKCFHFISSGIYVELWKTQELC